MCAQDAKRKRNGGAKMIKVDDDGLFKAEGSTIQLLDNLMIAFVGVADALKIDDDILLDLVKRVSEGARRKEEQR